MIDELAIYAATLYPVVHWHAHLEGKHFAWFVAGDFLRADVFERLETPARFLWAAALALVALRELWRVTTRRELAFGRVTVIASTAATWYVGIVLTNSDFDFTVTNVVTHGVPYVALLWAYSRARGAESPRGALTLVVRTGLGVFLGVLVVLAFTEELLWDRLVWHERPWLFGDGAALGEYLLAWVVPLLAVPQLTHYVLDGFLWRRGETRRLGAQRAALGFEGGGHRERLVDFQV